jgi:hypothetical protein
MKEKARQTALFCLSSTSTVLPRRDKVNRRYMRRSGDSDVVEDSIWPHIAHRALFGRRLRTNADPKNKCRSEENLFFEDEIRFKIQGLYPDHTRYAYRWTQ